MRFITARRIAGCEDLPRTTRSRLIALTLRRSLEQRVPVLRRLPAGEVRLRVPPGAVWLTPDTRDIDLSTFLEIFVDEIFPMQVAGRLVLDLGAHRGYFGAYALRRGAAAVVSYEPQSSNHASLLRTIATFPEGRWIPHRCAVGATARQAELHVSAESWSHSLYEPASGGVVAHEIVEVRPFADELHAARAAWPQLPVAVKINIEGAAGEVVLGTDPGDWRLVEEVVIDHEPTTPEPLADLLTHLERAGLVLVGQVGRNLRLARHG